MTIDNIRLRNEFINTQVITRNTGKKLGVVKEILVDIDQRELVALGLRDNILALSGMPQYLYLNSICQTGDVVLVEDENVFEIVDIDAYTSLINSEVITETGEPLGRVRDFQFNLENGKVSSIIIASLGYPQIPEQLISTYELSMEEVISSGPNRLIVFEGAEERLTQLSVGLLERLGIGRPAWEKEEEDMYYPPTARPENQLGTGTPIRTPVQVRQPVMEERWHEDDWEETRPAPPLRRQAETIRYEEDDYEEDNWGESKREMAVRQPLYEPEDDYDGDLWDESMEPEPYNPPRVNIPEKRREKMPEYYEE
ncbi:MAG: PRC-barrel domain-containing protein [Woronichinia naegeliana WA131]|jgi:sporulation protein YlmC with PRC-barrel domain|uniref:PRC-barrel domain-containing protein n=1 Tax=Woronichinia naegeliana WA131 TaxID=2824559 RepID=A0A977PXQ5_9CYAN|nr:MAG: PRC-barrel domain-containing protein [Woronichinia naegeliana WA131]